MFQTIRFFYVSFLQGLIAPSTGLASAQPVWSHWVEVGGSAEVLSQSTLWDGGQQRIDQGNYWRTSCCQSMSFLITFLFNRIWQPDSGVTKSNPRELLPCNLCIPAPTHQVKRLTSLTSRNSTLQSPANEPFIWAMCVGEGMHLKVQSEYQNGEERRFIMWYTE